MSGCPVRQVRHVYRRNGGGPLLSYSPLGGVCRIGCGPQPPPPPPLPPHTILINVGSNGITTLRIYISDGEGTYVVDNGVPVGFIDELGALNIDINVSPSSNVYINSTFFNIFELINYPIESFSISSAMSLYNLKIDNTNISGVFDVSKITDLRQLELTNNFITGVTGLNLCPFAEDITITNTNITQTAADSIANQINDAGYSNGTLDISSQKTGTINITGAIYNTLRGKNWTIS